MVVEGGEPPRGLAIVDPPASGEGAQVGRWERAVLWWGLVAVGVLAASILCGLPSGFDSGSLGGAIGLVGVTEAVLVLATLVVWLLSG